jgi:lysylphosphatidylglycerol synthetase-like protein (DUF2156 family)
MNKGEVVLVVLLLALVAGMFSFSSWDTAKVAGAQVKADAVMRGTSSTEQVAVGLGVSLTAKVISGVLVSLLVAVGIFAYQAAEIRRLKNGGWERFWERRSVKVREPRAKQPSLTELLTAIIARDITRRKD